MAVFLYDTRTCEYIQPNSERSPSEITRMTHAPVNTFSESDEYQCAHGLICVQFTLPSVSDAEKIQSYSYFLDFRTPSRP